MRVLITTNALGSIGGIQSYTCDLAFWLLDHGHSPVVYGPGLGETAALLSRRNVTATDDLSSIGVAPDIIHGNSSVETMIALLHFPMAPGLFVCHGSKGRVAAPPRFPRLLQFIAVDDTCADRLLLSEGLPAERVRVLLNAVDLSRFRQRERLPERPRRALVFSNSAHELTHLSVIRDACRAASIEVDALGAWTNNAVVDPETILGGYDLVFAKARCALEAMACGAAVIVCDVAGMAGMVRSSDVERLRRMNFGARSLTIPLLVDAIGREIAAYDRDDARAVSDRIRATAGTASLHESLLTVYEEVIDEHRRHDNAAGWEAEESRAAAAFLRRVAFDDPAEDQAGLNLLIRAAHRVLRTPMIGRALTRIARWLTRRR